MSKDCVFCKIVSGSIPNYNVYEDREFLGFLDVNPASKGHVLVIPKKHCRWVWDYKSPGDYFEVATLLAKKLRKVFDTDFVISKVIGDEVPHAHIHLIPAKTGRPYPNLSKRKKLSDSEMKDLAEKIKEAEI